MSKNRMAHICEAVSLSTVADLCYELLRVQED